MASPQFGILSIFDHNSQSWKAYKGRLTQFFIANNITDATDVQGERRRAILLSALADGTYRLASDLALPKEVQQVPYEDLLLVLDGHFTPKRRGFGERSTFYCAVQHAGESYAQWAARLRGLTADCFFSNVEEALRDRFVMGMLPGPERDKLFSQEVGDLTLAKSVELAEAVRCARAASNASTAATMYSAVPGQDQLFKISQRPPSANNEDVKRKCNVCGRFNHIAAKCRFANYSCKKCHKKGHLQKMCNNVYHVDTKDVEENGDDGKLFLIRSQNGAPMVEMVTIKGVSLKFQIDSGSSVTLISENVYEKYFQGNPIFKTTKHLITYTGNKITCVGFIKVPVTYADKTHDLDIYVVQTNGPPLLGRDFISVFGLTLSPCNFVTESNDIMNQLKSLYPQVFSDKLGTFNRYKIKLQLKPESKPVFFKARPVAFSLKAKIDSEIDNLLELGVLKPVDYSDYASPIVPVLKRNGTVRICADYSVTINKQLIVEQYPLPTIHELFTKLHGGEQFSKIDLSMAYNQFLLDEDSQDITCINTHRGLYKYTRLVFGMSSAPSIFQRAMDCVLSGMEGVLCLLDDVLITGTNKQQHLQRLQSVFERLNDVGLVVQKEKCEFFKNEINYLGYTIDKNGLRKSNEKVKAILEAPVPTNVHKLQSFLGLVNYYRNFVPNVSTILNPLYDLLRKGVKWSWLPCHNKSFNSIKQILASDQVLTHFNPNNTIILTVDASPTGLGSILSQIERDGTEKPIAYASRTLNAAEKKYAQIQKEATAIIFGVRRFHQYLYGRSVPFILRTDHKPLLSIFGPHKGIPEVTANRLQRYALFLSAYNYRIEFVNSNKNSADFLSRASLPEPESSNECTGASAAGANAVRVSACFRDESSTNPPDRAAYIHFVTDDSLPITRKLLRETTRTDCILPRIVNYILNGWPKNITDKDVRPYFLCRNQLSYEDGCVMRGHKIVLPEALWSNILTELHMSHLGVVKTKAEARSRFWFPRIDEAIENMINACSICTRLRQSPPKVPISPWSYPPQAFYRIHLDFLGPINTRMYLVIVDAYTKWVEVYEAAATSSTVIEKLHEYISRFGLPRTIVSDNATTFTSHEFQVFCSRNGIEHLTSPPYHAASNGQAESYVKIVKKGIKACVLSSTTNKERNLKLLKYLYDYRNSIHSTTGSSPAQLVYGRNLRTRLDLLNKTPPSSSTSLANAVRNKQCSQIKAGRGKSRRPFAIGDEVLYKHFINNNSYRWNRGTVLKPIGKVMYLVKDAVNSLNIRKHKNQLMIYRDRGNNNAGFWECDIELQQLKGNHSSDGVTNLTQNTSPNQLDAPNSTIHTTREEGGESSSPVPVSESQSAETEVWTDAHAGDPVPVSTTRDGDHRDTEDSSGLLLRTVPRVDYRRFF